ncbi:SDR family NAD(P)-dependent oxidoreductase [Usitatibacter palustris]|uniref:Benzil reductase ((S)-benzoin forming) n=1 Tax=Usitatibacter palustris TaxID=2732487 RepID=A0A6M4H976_9PROT|nr:SDR family NAD(P)-dependent oxidoreductase [Usitatibacter palustris]QJR15822.1 Benzil reductase ((S)-benzoin forming) [Usitatibacter palustris]
MNLYIVTGTTKGLGKALAEGIGASSENELIALSRAPEQPIPAGTQLEVDLASAQAVEEVFDRIEQRIRGKRFAKAVLINNAGVVSPVGPIERADAAELERNLFVNLVAPMLIMRRFLRATEGIALLRRIINISSGAGRKPIAGWAAYCAAKAGLDMASRAVALDFEASHKPVEIVSLAPGVIDTPMQGVVRSATAADFPDIERFKQMKADGTLRPAAEVAADILRLEAAGKLKGEPVADLRQLLS